jgi:hypothetical protein
LDLTPGEPEWQVELFSTKKVRCLMKRQLKTLFRLLSLAVISSPITPHATIVYNYTWVPQSDETTLARGPDHPLSFPIFTGNFQISEETVQSGTPGELVQVGLTVNYPYRFYTFNETLHVSGGGGTDDMVVYEHAPAPPIPLPYTLQKTYGTGLLCDPITGALTAFGGGIGITYVQRVRFYRRADLGPGLGPPVDGYVPVDVRVNWTETYAFFTPSSLGFYVNGDDGYYSQTWTEHGAWEVERRDIPDSGSTAAMLGFGVAGLIWLRRCVFAQHK